MKYENLMDIPDGYEMQLSEDFGEYPKGTKIIRGHANAYLDDDESVSFTFSDRCWYYLHKGQIEEIKKDYKGMKGSDKVMVELTGYQVAKLYALIGATECGTLCQSTQLYIQLAKILNSKDYQLFFDKIEFSEDLEVKIYEVLLEPETPVLTEAQKKALELKDTIAKAQKQLEELEKEI